MVITSFHLQNTCSVLSCCLLMDEYQWRIQDFPYRGCGPIRGGVDLRCGHFSTKMSAKTKELGPVGGACARHAPLDPPMNITYITYCETVFHLLSDNFSRCTNKLQKPLGGTNSRKNIHRKYLGRKYSLLDRLWQKILRYQYDMFNIQINRIVLDVTFHISRKHSSQVRPWQKISCQSRSLEIIFLAS